MAQKPLRVEIFNAGSFEENGQIYTITEADLERMASDYMANIGTHIIPYTRGHFQQPGEKAMGFVTEMTVEVGVLVAYITLIDKTFDPFEWPKASISLYPPLHPSNPNPQFWTPRHVAALSAESPRRPGLRVASFSDSGDGTVEFDTTLPVERSTVGAVVAEIGRLFSQLTTMFKSDESTQAASVEGAAQAVADPVVEVSTESVAELVGTARPADVTADFSGQPEGSGAAEAQTEEGAADQNGQEASAVVHSSTNASTGGSAVVEGGDNASTSDSAVAAEEGAAADATATDSGQETEGQTVAAEGDGATAAASTDVSADTESAATVAGSDQDKTAVAGTEETTAGEAAVADSPLAAALAREAALRAQLASAQAAQTANFCESLVRDGRMRPADSSKWNSVLASLYESGGSVNFSDSAQPVAVADAVKTLLASQPKVVEFAELSPPDTAPETDLESSLRREFRLPAGTQFSPESLAQLARHRSSK